MSESNKNHNLKIFFIKLISISLAVVFVINILFNLIITDKFKSVGLLLSIDKLETRRELGNKIRDDIEQVLKKEHIIKKEDKLLLYKLYQKIKSEFKNTFTMPIFIARSKTKISTYKIVLFKQKNLAFR